MITPLSRGSSSSRRDCPSRRQSDDGPGDVVQASHAGHALAIDQFDSAARVTGLGIARTISRRRFSPTRVAAEWRHELDHPEYSQRASEIGGRVRREDGVRAAGDVLEERLQDGLPAEAIVK